jgi:hypothetical protein
MSSVETTVKQLTNRLEDASSTEKLDALSELQTLARSDAYTVGQISLQRVLDFLREQVSAEEYEETLDLIYRLLHSKDTNAANSNTSILLADANNIDLLLDLLEHEDLTVGVMSSQILTEVHAKNGKLLEAQIQECPAGMNKLLQRLPDSSREEVRNQALVFIQQLTGCNEEMKKTVVFNEGFEILFNIIRSEGGFEDAGVVIQDCLQICNNILNDSETCQRLFFGMGPDWTLKLTEFFNPAYLETLNSGGGSGASADELDAEVWYETISYAKCAYLALNALACSLGVPNGRHQELVGITISGAVMNAAYWVARGGPAYITHSSLALLENAVRGNAGVGGHVMNVVLKQSPSQRGKLVPVNAEVMAMRFGWKPLSSDDRRCISVLSLLAERYVYPAGSWCGTLSFTDLMRQSGSGGELSPAAAAALPAITALSSADGFSAACLDCAEVLLAADEMATGMLVQYVLAPPPPMPDDDEEEVS